MTGIRVVINLIHFQTMFPVNYTCLMGRIRCSFYLYLSTITFSSGRSVTLLYTMVFLKPLAQVVSLSDNPVKTATHSYKRHFFLGFLAFKLTPVHAVEALESVCGLDAFSNKQLLLIIVAFYHCCTLAQLYSKHSSVVPSYGKKTRYIGQAF